MPLTPDQMSQQSTWNQRLLQLAFLILVVLVSIAVWKVSSSTGRVTLQKTPEGMMGTSCVLRVVVNPRDVQRAEALLADAERELRQCEALTSTWIETSEISRFNRAKAGEKVELSPFTLDFLKQSKQACVDTGGAFDITCGKVWQLWFEGQKKNALPDMDEIQRLRAESNWDNIELGENFAIKRNDNVEVVSGGLAKGMAVDRALEILKAGGVLSAFVEVGGDIAVFQNTRPIQVKAANAQTSECVSEIANFENGGICTSGHSERGFEIQGTRYSQILDPTTGRPVETNWSATVTADCAATADLWATTLEVLGEKGVEKLPPGVKVVEIQ